MIPAVQFVFLCVVLLFLFGGFVGAMIGAGPAGRSAPSGGTEGFTGGWEKWVIIWGGIVIVFAAVSVRKR
jgi:protein-S-isoprenylcysteine O-methyltransferase Ste14